MLHFVLGLFSQGNIWKHTKILSLLWVKLSSHWSECYCFMFLVASAIQKLAKWADCECSHHSRWYIWYSLPVRAFIGTAFCFRKSSSLRWRRSQTDCFGADRVHTVCAWRNRTEAENVPASETNAPNEPGVKMPLNCISLMRCNVLRLSKWTLRIHLSCCRKYCAVYQYLNSALVYCWWRSSFIWMCKAVCEKQTHPTGRNTVLHNLSNMLIWHPFLLLAQLKMFVLS